MNLPPDITSAVVSVTVQLKDGKPDIGSAFHIGKGYFATAGHVVAGGNVETILSLQRHDVSRKTRLAPGGKTTWSTTHPDFKYDGPFDILPHPDERIDVAIIRATGPLIGRIPTEDLQPVTKHAWHADAMSEGELLMSRVLVLGYPPIPGTKDAPLVVLKGEISAVVAPYLLPRRHFIISGMARGGFSGGPVVLLDNASPYGEPRSNEGTVIGVVGSSLVAEKAGRKEAFEELGFIAAVTIETVNEICAHYGIRL